jgi:hypothetical protein
MNDVETVLRRLESAIEAIDAEIARHEAGNGEVSNRQQLRSFRDALAEAFRRVESGHVPPKASRSGGLARVIVDSWPFNSALGDAIIAAEDGYLKL